MQYTQLGSTGLEVSRLCLGCMNFGSDAAWMLDDRGESIDLIHRALDGGINFLDTANVYSHGESEEIVGEAIASRNREELVVATKVFGEMHDGPNGSGLSRKHIIDQAYASLDRLGVEYIDLYQIHRFDEDTPVEETLSALTHLVDEGVVRYLGASTMSSYQFTKLLYTADLEGDERFVSMQPEYNAVDRHEEANLLPVCEGEGIGVIPWSPLARGYLTRPHEEYDATTRGETDDHAREHPYFEGGGREVNERVAELADEYGATMAQIGLAWLLDKEWVDAPIVGTTSIEHLEQAVAALDISLSDSDTEYLEEPHEPVPVSGHE